jgi:acyl carrier protein
MQDRIIRLIAQVRDDPAIATRITATSHLINDVGLDSLQLINLILLVEEEFAVEVDFDSFQIVHLTSIDRFANYIAELPRT